jgi:hypothetical protein
MRLFEYFLLIVCYVLVYWAGYARGRRKGK